MKKKIVKLVLICITAICLLTGCGITHCKECDDEVYKDGYCKYHYELYQVKDKIDDAGKKLYDAFTK